MSMVPPGEKQLPSDTPEFSALVTCYFEENSIDEFYTRLSSAMRSLGRSFEIIMVNDGSTDGTWEKLKEIFHKDPHVKTIMDFFKNSGQQAAVTACMCQARGRAIIYMDSDLQLAPEEIPLLVAEYDKGFDIVSGYRKERKDSLLRIAPSKIANMIMQKASQSDFRDFGCTFKIYNAALLRGFNLGPQHLFSNVDVIAKAGRRREIPITHYPRKYGKSGWTFAKLWKYNMDNIVSLSQRPFQYLAVASGVVALLFILRILTGFVLPFRILETVSTGLLLNFGIISLLIIVAILCLVGEFSIRAFVSARELPQYIIREKIER